MRALVPVLVLLALGGCDMLGGEVTTAKKVVAERFRDPASAKFENVVSGETTTGKSAVCGWVNAKNAYGAYAGFELFLVSEGQLKTLGSDVEEGWEGQLGSCVAGNDAATERLFRDVDRALDAYADAVK